MTNPNGIGPAMIRLMRSSGISLAAMEAAALVIAADARFKSWIVRNKHGCASGEQRLQLRQFYGEITERCRSIVVAFDNGGSNAALCRDLSRVAADLNEARSATVDPLR